MEDPMDELKALNALILLVVEATCAVGSAVLFAATMYVLFSPG